jgi:hypothetical protein
MGAGGCDDDTNDNSQRLTHVRNPLRLAVAALMLMACGCASLQTGADSAVPPESSNMALVGYSDLQGRSAFQPVIVEQNGRWIAYVGHHGGSAVNPLTGTNEANGTSIIDVTDPKRPRYLHHLPTASDAPMTGGEGTGAQMVQVCAGKRLPKGDPAKFYMLRTEGSKAHEIWDVTTPERPVFVSTVVGHLLSTHREAWECDTGIAYVNSGLPGWRVLRMTQVFDLSDPAKPVHVRDFALPGQEPSAPMPRDVRDRDGHGAFSMGPEKNRLYFGYGSVQSGGIQIVDRKKLLAGAKEPTPQNLLYPQVGYLPLGKYHAVHAVYPLLGMEIAEFAKDARGRVRDFLLVLPEPLANECGEERQMLFVVDVTNEAQPLGVSTFRIPEQPGNFCSRGARFGPHGTNENMIPMYHGRIVFVSWFNAGVRALDVRDPYFLKEVGYFVPAPNANTEPSCVKSDAGTRCKTSIQTNNVEVDDRGFIYMTDRNRTGMHILELTGAARAITNR